MTQRMLPFVFALLLLNIFCLAQNNYNEISLPELMKKKQQGDKNMVIVDVRTKGEYHDTVSRNKQSNIGRIKGAINITVQDLQQNPDAVKQLEQYKDKDIYLICSHSYRSRAASNILLKNGFTHVSNVQGGMTEWYRRYDELSPYASEFLENGIIYKNIGPAQLFNQLTSGKKLLLLGIRNTPRFWYDTANIKFYNHFPSFKEAVYYNYADSLKILEEVQKNKERPIVLFNMVNNGAAELAEWLTNKGIPDVSYLVGGANLFYEYVSNKQKPAKTDMLFSMQSGVRFITPVNFCEMTGDKKVQLIDVRHDTLFNKINKGTKHDYQHLKNAANFFSGNEISLYEQNFPDRKKEYVLVSENGIDGLELADALTKKGYTINWLIGGLQRWEWYMNNVGDFSCNDLLVK